ncbi:hypothetical protein [Fervidibacillus albus]|uniref:Phage tail protein n=1 Tax=Fervidibacillus albus TaxID=2980026 RepID=A0A9E8LV99_9BACI|nr:hypothetical protein [Fervidibacillus albus]WAA10332.1 hypothetical protein OE104_03080 [Fervidibacillus albus]
MGLKQEQLQNIQIDYGIVFLNYGEIDQKQLGPTRGGGTLTVTATYRTIEHDGHRGPTKGLEVVDEIDAVLAVTNLDASLDTLSLSVPYAKYDQANKKITINKESIGLVKETAYLKNITMFAKTVKGEYKKISLFNAMSKNDFSLAAAPKAEGTISLEVHAHWDPTDDQADYVTIEDVPEIVETSQG